MSVQHPLQDQEQLWSFLIPPAQVIFSCWERLVQVQAWSESRSQTTAETRGRSLIKVSANRDTVSISASSLSPIQSRLSRSPSPDQSLASWRSLASGAIFHRMSLTSSVIFIK